LTVHQPWAWALAGGWKPVENRDWPPPASLIGHHLVIHAGRQYDEAAAFDLRANAAALGLPEVLPGPKVAPLGAIVAVAYVAGAVLVEDLQPGLAPAKVIGNVSEQEGRQLAASPWACGPWLWVVRQVVAIPPIPCRGFQKLWTVPPSIADQVRVAWKAARSSAA
jgi:hypothetical protein